MIVFFSNKVFLFKVYTLFLHKVWYKPNFHIKFQMTFFWKPKVFVWLTLVWYDSLYCSGLKLNLWHLRGKPVNQEPCPLFSNSSLTYHLPILREKTGMCMSISLALYVHHTFYPKSKPENNLNTSHKEFYPYNGILCSRLTTVHAEYLMTKTSLDKNAKIWVIIPISKYVYVAWVLKIIKILLAMTKHLTRPRHIKGLFFSCFSSTSLYAKAFCL